MDISEPMDCDTTSMEEDSMDCECVDTITNEDGVELEDMEWEYFNLELEDDVPHVSAERSPMVQNAYILQLPLIFMIIMLPLQLLMLTQN